MSKILIVEDNEMNRDMLSRRLLRRGYDVVMAVDGQEGLDMMRSESPDLVLMDIQMPEMDGYTLTAEIKNTPELQKLHVVLHTSLSGVFNQAMVQKVGADDFIAKFHPDELATAVQKWLMTECE